MPMSTQQLLPRQITQIETAEPFAFDCHRGVGCFTTCCRELELALTPYDLLRIRKATGLHSRAILDRYVIIEQEPKDVFPRFYLTMVDDGNASCVFLGSAGCSIYPNRPGGCRTYPLGRATVRTERGLQEHFVLLREAHCLGFHELSINTVASYLESQGLDSYNHFNDRLTEIIQHDQIRKGMQLDERQRRLFILTLYDLDSFRDELLAGRFSMIDTGKLVQLQNDDEALLDYGLRWLKKELFGARHAEDRGVPHINRHEDSC